MAERKELIKDNPSVRGAKELIDKIRERSQDPERKHWTQEWTEEVAKHGWKYHYLRGAGEISKEASLEEVQRAWDSKPRNRNIRGSFGLGEG